MRRFLFLTLCCSFTLLYSQQSVVFPDDFKTNALNGKEVTISNKLTLTNNYSSASGTITLSNGQLWIPTEKHPPGVDTFNKINKDNKENQITVKKGSYSFIDSDGTCRIGQTVEGLTGKASYSNGAYTITLTKQPTFSGNQRPTSSEVNKQYNLKVASFNLEHFGINNEFYSTKLEKIYQAMQAMQADIYALVEVEGVAGLNELCALMNSRNSTQKYTVRYYKDNAQGMACYIYNSEVVTHVGNVSANTLASNYLPDRKTAQGFQMKSNGERFILCCNHWKSKSGSNVPEIYKDKGDGQSAYNARRVQEAEATLTFIEDIKKVYNDPDVLVVGDLNAYTMEDPIRILEDGGLVNLLTEYAPDEYSYAFWINGSYGVGYLDHSLATRSMEQQVVYACPFRINADEPGFLDIEQKGVQAGNMYRCSDHNPIITFINLNSGSTGIENSTTNRPVFSISGYSRNGFITLSCSAEVNINRVELMNISGQIVYSHYADGKRTNELNIPINGLTSGFYLTRVYFDDEYVTLKVVVP